MRIDEIGVLGDHDALLLFSQHVDLFVGAAVGLRQIQRVDGVTPAALSQAIIRRGS